MRRHKYLSYILIAIGLYILWSAAILPFGVARSFICGSCHATSLAYRSSSRSKHKDIGCLACHRGPGIGGRVSTDLRAWRNLTASLIKRPPQEVHVANDNCLACHDNILDWVVVSKAIKMSHREVIDAGWRCGDCHGNTGHALPGAKAGLQNPTMDKCMRCHNASRRLRECALCHMSTVGRRAPANRLTMGTVAHNGNWKTRGHGQADQKICVSCHEKESCGRCHKIDLPHPREDWPYEHSAEAKIDSARCRQCHRVSFCEDCHKVTMPHGADYERLHMTEKTPEAVCLKCHFKDQCEACHRAHRTHKVGGR